MATSMNILGESMNTMEKPTKTVAKLMNSANCRIWSKFQKIEHFCSKMQQVAKKSAQTEKQKNQKNNLKKSAPKN